MQPNIDDIVRNGSPNYSMRPMKPQNVFNKVSASKPKEISSAPMVQVVMPNTQCSSLFAPSQAPSNFLTNNCAVDPSDKKSMMQ